MKKTFFISMFALCVWCAQGSENQQTVMNNGMIVTNYPITIFDDMDEDFIFDTIIPPSEIIIIPPIVPTRPTNEDGTPRLL